MLHQNKGTFMASFPQHTDLPFWLPPGCGLIAQADGTYVLRVPGGKIRASLTFLSAFQAQHLERFGIAEDTKRNAEAPVGQALNSAFGLPAQQEAPAPPPAPTAQQQIQAFAATLPAPPEPAPVAVPAAPAAPVSPVGLPVIPVTGSTTVAT